MLRQNYDQGERFRQGGEGGPEGRPDAAGRGRAPARAGHRQHHGKREEGCGAGGLVPLPASGATATTASKPLCVCESDVQTFVQIRNILKQGIETPEDQNDLRKMQLRELARLNGTLREDDNR